MKYIAGSKPVEDYMVRLDSYDTGLFINHGHNPEVLGLILLTTPYGYEYEYDIRSSPGKVTAGVPEIGFQETLDVTFNGVTLREYIKTFNPWEMFRLFVEMSGGKSLDFLPAVQHTHAGRSDVFLFTVRARVGEWLRTYRGIVSEIGNMAIANFPGNPHPAFKEFIKDSDNLLKVLKEKYATEKIKVLN